MQTWLTTGLKVEGDWPEPELAISVADDPGAQPPPAELEALLERGLLRSVRLLAHPDDSPDSPCLRTLTTAGWQYV